MWLRGCSDKTGGNTDSGGDTTASPDGSEHVVTDKEWTIGISFSFTGNAFRSLCIATLEQELAKMPNVTAHFMDGQNDINKQVSDVESLIAMGVDGIIILPGSSEALEPVLTEARQMGIPVGVFDKEIFNDDAYDFYVGPNTSEQAELMTRWLFDKIGGKGNIVQLGGTPGNSGTAIWLEKCDELLESEYKDIKVLAYKDTNWKEDTSKQVMTDLLLAYPGEIDAVWCDGSQSAAGAIKACLAAGVEPLPTIGNTAYCGVIRIFEEEKDTYPDWDVCLSSKPATLASDCLYYMIDKLEGKELPAKDITPDPIAIDLREKGAEIYDPKLPDSMYADHTLTEENLAKLLESDIFSK